MLFVGVIKQRQQQQRQQQSNNSYTIGATAATTTATATAAVIIIPAKQLLSKTGIKMESNHHIFAVGCYFEWLFFGFGPNFAGTLTNYVSLLCLA